LPRSNGIAEAFVKTIKRDYVAVNPTPDAATVLAQLRAWFTDYNLVHPHSALKYRPGAEDFHCVLFYTARTAALWKSW
jgi:putative transposase